MKRTAQKRRAAQHQVDKRLSTRATQETGLTIQNKLLGDLATVMALPERVLPAAQDTNPASATFGQFQAILDMDGLV